MHPSYFCPKGINRPDHIKLRVGVNQPGPDGEQGVAYGMPYDARDTWHKTDAGWWVCMDGIEKRDIMRVNAMPGMGVSGWIVPHLMRIDGTAAVGHFGPSGLVIPRHIVPIIERLRSVACTGKVEFEHAQLAADILALNYHISLHEIGLMEWMPLPIVWEILDAALGCTKEERNRLEQVIQEAEAARVG